LRLFIDASSHGRNARHARPLDFLGIEIAVTPSSPEWVQRSRKRYVLGFT